MAAIYFITWWVVLFAVLPFGVRSQQESGSVEEGTDPGAPAIPRLLSKVIWTTVVTTVLFGVCYTAFAMKLITFDDIANRFGMPTR